MRFDTHAIKVGIKGILNVLRHLKMLHDGAAGKPLVLKSFFSEKNIWIRASTSGISYTSYRLGQHVKKGEVLCTINDPFGATESNTIICQEEAIIVGKNNLPLVHEGEALFQLAIFPKMSTAANHLESWSDQSLEHFNLLGAE